jgi:hypothetical protein
MGPDLDAGQSIAATVSSAKLEWVIKAFGPYKSAAIHGVIPAMLQHAMGRVIPWLLDIFRGCLNLGYIPTSWKRVRVIFIPKAGKSGHSKPNDYRPISLNLVLTQDWRDWWISD